MIDPEEYLLTSSASFDSDYDDEDDDCDDDGDCLFD